PGARAGPTGMRVWVKRLRLTDFRNYRSLSLSVGPAPVVLSGANGSGKTNLLEAVSLLTSGQGLRRAPYPELARVGATAWAVAARLNTPLGGVDIGTGLAEGPDGDRRPERGVARNTGRIVRVGARFEAFERIMAETGVAIAAARAVAVAELAAAIGARRDAGAGALFPWAELALVGTLESALAARPAIEVEDDYFALLGRERERDRVAGRTLDGPHRSDLAVGHGPKELPAKVCSTGEQKALLVGLVLAHCDVVGQRQEGAAPILILDEITAHLDPLRRAALFE